MESSIAEFLWRQPACELLRTMSTFIEVNYKEQDTSSQLKRACSTRRSLEKRNGKEAAPPARRGCQHAETFPTRRMSRACRLPAPVQHPCGRGNDTTSDA